MAKQTRQCAICDGEIKSNTEYITVKRGKQPSYIHLQCASTYDTGKISEEELQEILRMVINKKIQQKRKDTVRKKVENPSEYYTNRDNFIKYIQETYDINSFTNADYLKFANIVNGSYRDLKEGIPFEDLLFMFQRQYNNLNKIYQECIAKGKKFKDSKARFNYDLAIIINKYDSYKKWKQKQEILKAEISTEEILQKESIKIDYSKISNNKPTVSNELDIEDILDDIY